MKRIHQSAGHDELGTFAPAFAHYNDDVLFGENWNDDALSYRQRCLLTLAALVCTGSIDSSLSYHLHNAKQAGVSRTEIAGVLTHLAFYAGWPKAWAAFRQAKEVWNDQPSPSDDETERLWSNQPSSLDAQSKHAADMIFPIGKPNDAYASYFSGKSYIATICDGPLPIVNVTFEPGCKNHWHIHHAKSGGGQILICVGGVGYYQAWDTDPIELKPGDVAVIPAGTKHWHGAGDKSWFSHLAIEVPGTDSHHEWLEPVHISK